MFFSPSRLFALFFCLVLTSSLWAGAIPKQEEHEMVFGWWKLPKEFSEKRIETLIQKLADETYEKGFRYLGVEEDLFHGHVLFEKKNLDGVATLYPRAILYHTQEEAHKAHWEKSIDAKYDYLNVAARNWIQWLSDDPKEDGVLIENAKKYLDTHQKDPSQFETDFAEPQENLHYTIHAKNLDPNKLGFTLAGELQFEFDLVKEVSNNPYPDLPGNRGPIDIRLTPQNLVKLQLSTKTMFLERTAP